MLSAVERRSIAIVCAGVGRRGGESAQPRRGARLVQASHTVRREERRVLASVGYDGATSWEEESRARFVQGALQSSGVVAALIRRLRPDQASQHDV